MLEMRKGWEQGFDLEMSAGAELTVRAPQSMVAATCGCGGSPALQINIFTSRPGQRGERRSGTSHCQNKTSQNDGGVNVSVR